MGLRFRKSINLGGGFRINMSKSGIGYSWGVKGFRKTKTANGRTRTTVSVPGTGISYVTESGKKKNKLPDSKKTNNINDQTSGFVPKKTSEYSAKALRRFVVIFRVFSVLIIFLSLILCTAIPVVGVLGILFGVLFWVISNNYKKIAIEKENGTFSEKSIIRNVPDNKLLYKSYGFFEFPETDNEGHEVLKIFDINVTGVMNIHDGIDPQIIIPMMCEGDRVILEADQNNEYDSCAVKVKTLDDVHIGWLPKGENLQIDIYNRLIDGQTVYARVKKGYLLNNYPGKVGLVIDVARYSKR